MTLVHSALTRSIPLSRVAGLITKLEAAEVGSSSLDREVMTALAIKYDGMFWRNRPTQHVDAALALAERVLPADPDFRPATPSAGWKLDLYRGMVPTADRGGWFATIRRHAQDGYRGAHESPALALCIAVLKACAAGNGDAASVGINKDSPQQEGVKR